MDSRGTPIERELSSLESQSKATEREGVFLSSRRGRPDKDLSSFEPQSRATEGATSHLDFQPRPPEKVEGKVTLLQKFLEYNIFILIFSIGLVVAGESPPFKECSIGITIGVSVFIAAGCCAICWNNRDPNAPQWRNSEIKKLFLLVSPTSFWITIFMIQFWLTFGVSILILACLVIYLVRTRPWKKQVIEPGSVGEGSSKQEPTPSDVPNSNNVPKTWTDAENRLYHLVIERLSKETDYFNIGYVKEIEKEILDQTSLKNQFRKLQISGNTYLERFNEDSKGNLLPNEIFLRIVAAEDLYPNALEVSE